MDYFCFIKVLQIILEIKKAAQQATREAEAFLPTLKFVESPYIFPGVPTW